jgi:hypothetical protein
MSNFEDYVATRQLASIYCSAVDDGNTERMASLFVPNGQLIVYSVGSAPGSAEPLRRWEGAEGFGKLITVLGQSYLRWVHFLGNHWVEVNGDTAQGEAYVFACHLRAGDNGEEEEVAVIRYRDNYVRTVEGWRFSERHAYRQWTTLRGIDARQHGIDTALHGTPSKQ